MEFTAKCKAALLYWLQTVGFGNEKAIAFGWKHFLKAWALELSICMLKHRTLLCHSCHKEVKLKKKKYTEIKKATFQY